MKRMFVATIALMIVGLPAFSSAQLVPVVHPQDHFLTFDIEVALPGGVTLPAGTYRFRFPNGNTGWTQVVSQDESKVFAMLMTTSTQRDRDKADGIEVVLVKRPGPVPPLLKAWFCAGNVTGHEFTGQAKP